MCSIGDDEGSSERALSVNAEAGVSIRKVAPAKAAMEAPTDIRDSNMRNSLLKSSSRGLPVSGRFGVALVRAPRALATLTISIPSSLGRLGIYLLGMAARFGNNAPASAFALVALATSFWLDEGEYIVEFGARANTHRLDRDWLRPRAFPRY
jgi:hypothetical protein